MNIELHFEHTLDLYNSWNDKNDTKSKNNDIIMLNNRKADFSRKMFLMFYSIN